MILDERQARQRDIHPSVSFWYVGGAAPTEVDDAYIPTAIWLRSSWCVTAATSGKLENRDQSTTTTVRLTAPVRTELGSRPTKEKQKARNRREAGSKIADAFKGLSRGILELEIPPKSDSGRSSREGR